LVTIGALELELVELIALGNDVGLATRTS
jgi:hypothetical protein